MREFERMGYTFKCQTLDSYLDSTSRSPFATTWDALNEAALQNGPFQHLFWQSERPNLTNKSSSCCGTRSAVISTESPSFIRGILRYDWYIARCAALLLVGASLFGLGHLYEIFRCPWKATTRVTTEGVEDIASAPTPYIMIA